MSSDQPQELQQQLDQIEQTIRRMETFPDPAVGQMGRTLTAGLLQLHRAGVGRLVELFMARAKDEHGRLGLADALTDDELINSLLALHGLHPLDLRSRLQRAVERLGPAMAHRGYHIQILQVDEYQTLLRVRGEAGQAGSAPPGSAVQQEIEQAVRKAVPEIDSIEFEGSPQTAASRTVGVTIPLPILQKHQNGTPDSRRSKTMIKKLPHGRPS